LVVVVPAAYLNILAGLSSLFMFYFVFGYVHP
jgi:hypothetical protein